jgi:GMP synthase (glutamine-hydrolysing)
VQARQLKSPDLAETPAPLLLGPQTADVNEPRLSPCGGARVLARARRPGLRRPGGSLMTVWAVIEHVSYDGQGNVRQALSRAGLRSVTLRPFLGDELPSVTDLSGLIVLGAPTGSADDELPEQLPRERCLIADAVRHGLPVLGVCFGAQLVAVALGGRTIKDGPAELGMGTVSLTPAGQADPVLRSDNSVFDALHWHRHSYTLPPRAVRLATSGRGVEQAFRYNENVYGLQFHVEINSELAGVIAEQLPEGALEPGAVIRASRWGSGMLDRFLALR